MSSEYDRQDIASWFASFLPNIRSEYFVATCNNWMKLWHFKEGHAVISFVLNFPRLRGGRGHFCRKDIR
jgi:hypothetical protein